MQARPEGVGGKMYTLLSRALEIDPDYIPALDLLGGAYWFLAGETDLTWEEMERKIDANYDRILELDPDNAYPDFYHAFQLSGENRLEESAALYSGALEKDLTKPDYVRLAGYFALHIGKLDAATRLLKHALAIDPLCHQCRRRYAGSLMFAGDYANAQWEYERYLAGANQGWDDYAVVLLLQGMASEALAYIDSIDIDDDQRQERIARQMRAMALYSLGEFAEADRVFEELMTMQVLDKRDLKFNQTVAAAWMGKNDLAFENLFAMAATGFKYLQQRTFSPIWRKLHDDPRWLEYREFNGMSAERLDAIEFDPDLPE